MANKLYVLGIVAFLLTSCMINETIDTKPYYVASTPFTSTEGKQIIKISDNELIITSSVIAKNDDSNYDKLTRFRALKSAYDYFWQENVDPYFISIYSENIDYLNSTHFLDLQKKVSRGILEKIENIETNTTFLGNDQIIASKYKTKFFPPKKFNSNFDFMIDLNKEIYNPTDTLTVFIQTVSPCYVQLILLHPDRHTEQLTDQELSSYLYPGKIYKFSKIFVEQNSGKGVIKIFASDNPIEFKLDNSLKKTLNLLLTQLAKTKNRNITEIDLEFTIK